MSKTQAECYMGTSIGNLPVYTQLLLDCPREWCRPNSTSAAVCRELAMIVTKLGLPLILRSDNGPCYSFTVSCNVTASHTSPNHPRSNGERMVGVAKKLIDKSVKEGKPWISGLFDCRITPQSGSIASPLELMTQCTPREKSLPQLPSSLGAP